jgi:prevent-host-death family protein
MDAVNIYEAKTQLSALVERAAAGEEIIIAKNGRAVARLVPLAKRTAPRPLGRFKGEFDMAEDFAAPLPEAIMTAYRGETGCGS